MPSQSLLRLPTIKLSLFSILGEWQSSLGLYFLNKCSIVLLDGHRMESTLLVWRSNVLRKEDS